MILLYPDLAELIPISVGKGTLRRHIQNRTLRIWATFIIGGLVAFYQKYYDVPDKLRAAALGAVPRAACGAAPVQPTVCRGEAAAAIDWYRQGLVSQGSGAEIAGVPRADFINALADRKIEVAQIDLEALERDLEHA